MLFLIAAKEIMSPFDNFNPRCAMTRRSHEQARQLMLRHGEGTPSAVAMT